MRTGLLRTIRFVLAEGTVARSDTTVDICRERSLFSKKLSRAVVAPADYVIQRNLDKILPINFSERLNESKITIGIYRKE